MAVRLITPPAVEPVSLEDLKRHLRIDHDQEDETLATLIVVARSAVERLTRRLTTTQTWRVTLDRVPPGGTIPLPLSPVQTVTALRVAAADGSLQTFPSSELLIDLVGEPARILFKGAPPLPGLPVSGIEIDVVCGYGPTAAAVPADIAQAVKLLAGHWYDSRGEAPAPASIPADVRLITDLWRLRRLAA